MELQSMKAESAFPRRLCHDPRRQTNTRRGPVAHVVPNKIARLKRLVALRLFTPSFQYVSEYGMFRLLLAASHALLDRCSRLKVVSESVFVSNIPG
jgi:hypothetical protein